MGFWGVGVLPFWVIKIYICTSVSSVFRGGGGRAAEGTSRLPGGPGDAAVGRGPFKSFRGVVYSAAVRRRPQKG